MGCFETLRPEKTGCWSMGSNGSEVVKELIEGWAMIERVQKLSTQLQKDS